MSALERFNSMMTEEQVCRLYPDLISLSELKKARQNGEIAFFKGKRGKIHYQPDAIARLIAMKEVPCQSGYSSSADTGFGNLPFPGATTPAGTTSEGAERLADHLAQKFSTKRKSASSSSPAPPPRQEEAAPPNAS